MTKKPFSLLVKPASADCNLRCKYCFYLDHAELYPENKIHRMSDEVLEKMISKYMDTDQPQYSFGWQGGEPTLMGVEFFRKVVQLQEKYAKKGARIANGLQTNATRIDDEFAAFLAEYNFLVGVSLDGPQEIHDQYRLSAGGTGTHSKVWEGIEALRRHQVEFNILTLVSSSNVKHGREVYRYLKENGFYYHQYIPCVEFDPQGKPLPFTITGKEWGDFMIEVFDEWIHHEPYQISVRLFDSLISFMVEGWASVCHMGGNCCQYFVVEYNGDIYPCDFFVEKKRKLGNITEHSWDDMQVGEKYKEFGQLKNHWNKSCSNCKHLLYCSGDCLKHRIYNSNPPENISWLCQGWKQFYDYAIPQIKELSKSVLIQRQEQGMIPKSLPINLFIDQKLERNDLCFCGSGKKYKKCHGTSLR